MAGKFGAAEWRLIHSGELIGKSRAATQMGRRAFDNDSVFKLRKW